MKNTTYIQIWIVLFYGNSEESVSSFTAEKTQSQMMKFITWDPHIKIVVTCCILEENLLHKYAHCKEDTLVLWHPFDLVIRKLQLRFILGDEIQSFLKFYWKTARISWDSLIFLPYIESLAFIFPLKSVSAQCI